MIVVDTTVLVYAVGVDHPLREPCRAVITAVQDGSLAVTTTVEAIQEFCQVRARRRGRADAVELSVSYAELFTPLVSLETNDLVEGLRLFGSIEPLGAFDAVLAACALRRDATGLISADRAFSKVPGLHHLDPAHPRFLSDLARAK